MTAVLAPALRAQESKPDMFGNAEAYERFMGRWSRLLAPGLTAFAGLPAAGNVLDIGSGAGALAFAIAAREPGVSVAGIDPSNEYVAFASSRNTFGDRVTFEIGDARKLRFADASIYACLSLLVINFIPDPGQALREMVRVTRPGAPIAAAVWDYGDGMRMLRIFWDAAAAVDPAAARLDERHMPLCRSAELGELWKSAGLLSVEERGLAVETRFASFDDFWEPFLLGQGPAGSYVRGLAGTRRDALRLEVHRRLAPRDGAIALQARAWAVRGFAPPRA
ncbi:MAG: methyltransferase domain-containing protein [Bryobacteraceae bacterium]